MVYKVDSRRWKAESPKVWVVGGEGKAGFWSWTSLAVNDALLTSRQSLSRSECRCNRSVKEGQPRNRLNLSVETETWNWKRSAYSQHLIKFWPLDRSRQACSAVRGLDALLREMYQCIVLRTLIFCSYS